MTQSSNHPAIESHSTPTINKFAAGLVRRKARELCYQAGFSRCDRADIEQELTLALLRRLSKFDPAIAHYNAFVTTVVERYSATLIAHQRAESRDYSRLGRSLNSTVEDADGLKVEIGSTLTSDCHERRTGQSSVSGETQSDLAMDVAAILKQLPPELADICERLKRGTISEVAIDLGIPRSSLCTLLTRLRERFESGELRDYLANAPSKSSSSR